MAQAPISDPLTMLTHHFVMAGLDPAIHDLLRWSQKTWMPGTRPGMTKGAAANMVSGLLIGAGAIDDPMEPIFC